MDQKYFPKKVERKWQERWSELKTFEASQDDQRDKYYCLEMLPYPSGRLHMGHVRNYSIGDAVAWYMRLNGYNVIHPIGWDSFGQPAEQAAIKMGVNPRDWTEDNISQMRSQLKSLGIGYDWSKEIAAHRPDYYKFDQWFFLKMYEKGLAYRKDSDVNWCPQCETTLSNEQASGGICWRCGTPVEKQSRPQWFVKITKYADELLEGMKEIEAGWPEKVLTMQRNWIGKSEGAYIDFKIKNAGDEVPAVRVFTTRIDTIFGANAVVVAPGHPLIEANIEAFSDDVRTRIAEIEKEQATPKDYEEEVEKDGIDTGLTAVNPFSGEELPVWAGNYVMMSYGTGAVMSVPAHDERDHEFAVKFGLPVLSVIDPAPGSDVRKEDGIPFMQKGVLVNSGDWSGKHSIDAIEEMSAYAEREGFGEKAVTYRLRDWGISRQRFWGAPIPIIHCDDCGTVAVPYDDLPVELPESAPFTGVGESPLAKVEDFVNTKCSECGGTARRETDTMDTFVDSTWYYFRYLDPKNDEMPFEPDIASYWMPVDLYIGGIDHAVMHLLYTRFWTKMMRDIYLVRFDEPVKSLLTQGMVVGESFYSKSRETYVFEDDVEIERDQNGKITRAILKADGSEVRVAVEKMSKSKHNGVDPDDMISIYGADAVRLFVLFAAPAENELVWQESGIEGAVRFLQRFWRYVLKWKDAVQDVEKSDGGEDGSKAAKDLRRKTHQTILRIRENFDSRQFNTPVAALMELSNAMGDVPFEPDAATAEEKYAVKEAIEALILMLAPYAPHYAEETWEAVTGAENGILGSGARFPEAVSELAEEDEIEIAVQVNGKLRSRVYASPGAGNELLEAAALNDEKVKEYTDGKKVVKVIVVPGRLVNVVVR
ncbi:MAG: leucine--tRNA ligase [Acidobacteria bacterium]|nr:MAG: leucine--tRNA ligase [Acidobacteriota bacterium]REK02210.1 MAG: leucine--tRNA ligase [Acidobacteriota bacterium]REK13987.1 MAG: leucine--tRNA ligase [Acidobacteriota bacterium]REK41982.1 MAG: leucine--tRNA ligase [Acidobacteriota bacterium]